MCFKNEISIYRIFSLSISLFLYNTYINIGQQYISQVLSYPILSYPIRLSIYLSIYLFIYLSIFQLLCSIRKGAGGASQPSGCQGQGPAGGPAPWIAPFLQRKTVDFSELWWIKWWKIDLLHLKISRRCWFCGFLDAFCWLDFFPKVKCE